VRGLADHARALARIGDWCRARGLSLAQIEPILLAAYVEDLFRQAPRDMHLHLALVRSLLHGQS
jgi:hypothetical protein